MGQNDIDLDVADVTRAGACGNLAQLLGDARAVPVTLS